MAKIIKSERHQAIILEISNPDKRNAITIEMYNDLEKAFIEASEDENTRAVVMTGSGQAFAGGTDINHLTTIQSGHDGVEYEAHMARVQSHLLRLRVPVISLVRGPCVGGGLALAALSDIVLCTPNAKFGSPIAHTIGNTISATTYARLQHTFGARASAEMLMTGALISAENAEKYGFVNSVHDEEIIENKLDEMLMRISRGAPKTIWSIKEIQHRANDYIMGIDTDDVFEKVYGSDDFRAGVRAFISREPAQFSKSLNNI